MNSIPVLASLLFAALASAQPAAPGAAAPPADAEAWMDVATAQYREMAQGGAPKTDMGACQECLAGMEFLNDCKDISLKEFETSPEKKHACESSCEVTTTAPFDKMVLKRRDDAKCGPALADAAGVKAVADAFGMPEIKDQVGKCSVCTAAADFAKNKESLRNLRRGLSDALQESGAGRAASLRAAVDNLKAHEDCSAPSDACKFKP